MDHEIERLLEALRAAGRYESALIILVGDHGELLGEHGLFAHPTWHYEELLRVPLLVRFPEGRDAGRVLDTPFSVVDLLPLVAQEVGFVLPDGVEGLPLGERRVVLAESFRDPVSIDLYGERADRDLASIIRWPWKLTQSDRGERELYRLDADPKELRNLSGREAVEGELLRELGAALDGLSAPESADAPEAVAPATMERLRELGYID
jgi:arylsulfatase A-like enzyme